MSQFDYKYKVPFGNQTASSAQNFQAAGVPTMQGELVNPDVLKEKAQDTYVANRVTEEFEEIDPLKLWAVGLPAWFVTSEAMEVFARASRGTDYSKTIQGRIGNFGDKVSSFLTGNKLAKSRPMQAIGNAFNNTRRWIVDKAFKHSAILRSMKTPTSPELEMVKGQANGMRGFLLYDYPQVAENFLENNLKHVKDLDCYGADRAFIQAKQALIRGGADFAEVMERAQFELLSSNKNPAFIDRCMKLSPESRAKLLQNMKAKALGFDNFKHYTDVVKGDIQGRWKELLAACDKSAKNHPNMYSKIWTSDKNLWTKFKGMLFGRKVQMSEFRNKIISATGHLPDGTLAQKTKLGKWLPKLTNYFLEGATNRVAGGKLVALMNATMLAEVLIRTAKAEKGDKFQTFTERTTEMVGFFAFSPLALRLLHIFGGVQYAGISENTVTKLLTKLETRRTKGKISVNEYNAAKEVLLKAKNAMAAGKNPTEAYRAAFNFFNDKATMAQYASKKEWKSANKALKGILKGDSWNPLVKLAKKAARFFTVGIEQIAPYRTKALHLNPEFGFKKVGQMLKDALKHPKYWFKQASGYPVRIIAVFLMLMPFLNKLGVKVSHAIFGRPSKSLLDSPADETANQMTQEQVVNQQQAAAQQTNPNYQPNLSSPTNLINMAQQGKNPNGNPFNQQPQQQSQQPQQPYQPDLSSPTNLINMAKNGTPYQNEMPNIPDYELKQPEVPAQKELPADTELEPVRTYIPSSDPVKLTKNEKEPSDKDLDKLFKKADAAEKLAMDTLAMKW